MLCLGILYEGNIFGRILADMHKTCWVKKRVGIRCRVNIQGVFGQISWGPPGPLPQESYKIK